MNHKEYGCTCPAHRRSAFCLAHPPKAKPRIDFEGRMWSKWLTRLKADVATLVHIETHKGETH
jgi:hypothetical protein